MPLYINNVTLLLYFIVFVSILFLSVIAIVAKIKILDNVLFSITFIIAICFYGFRYPGTPDIPMYIDNFKNLGDFSSFPWTLSFYYLMKFLRVFGNSADIYLISSSFVFISAMSIAIIKITPLYFRTFVLISYVMSWGFLDLATNTIRQGIAVPFLLLFAHYLVNKKYLLSVVFMLMAVGLHWSAAIISLLIFFGVLFSGRTKFIRLFSIFIYGLLVFSFFIDLNFAKWLGSGSLSSFAANITMGVNLVGKIDAYLNSGVDGANFYEMITPRRIYNVSEIFIYLTFNVYMYTYLNKKNIIIDDVKYRSYYSIFIMLSAYSIFLISMTWFFRNMYWALGFAPILSALSLVKFCDLNRKNRLPIIVFYCLILVVFSSVTCWRVPLMEFSYPR